MIRSCSVKWIVLGASGMLGHVLVKELASSCHVLATTRRSSPLPASAALAGRLKVLSNVSTNDLDTIRRVIGEYKPSAVVNCIGLIKQQPDARNPTAAILTNALFPHQLHTICAKFGIRLVHISTDCVFSGAKGDYTENDIPDPVDLYGRSKLLGEVSGDNALTLRTSLIGPELNSRRGLFEWFMDQRGKEVEGYVNAIFSGFTTFAFSRVLRDILINHQDLNGVWHVSTNPVSKYELLKLINDTFDLNIKIRKNIDVRCDRSLNCSRFRSRTGFSSPTWEQMVAELADDCRENEYEGKLNADR